MANNKTAQIIRQLKDIREKRGLTYQNVHDLVEKSGNHVSFSTIRRVFAEGSEEREFKYNDSIRPIVIALVGQDPIEPQEGQVMSIAEQEANALRTVAALKEDMIQELREENQRIQEEATARLDYLKEESEKKSAHIAALTAQINRKDRAISWLVIAVIALAVLIIAALIIDRINPNLGYFWRNVSAFIGGGNVSGSGPGGGGTLLLSVLWGRGR